MNSKTRELFRAECLKRLGFKPTGDETYPYEKDGTKYFQGSYPAMDCETDILRVVRTLSEHEIKDYCTYLMSATSYLPSAIALATADQMAEALCKVFGIEED